MWAQKFPGSRECCGWVPPGRKNVTATPAWDSLASPAVPNLCRSWGGASAPHAPGRASRVGTRQEGVDLYGMLCRAPWGPSRARCLPLSTTAQLGVPAGQSPRTVWGVPGQLIQLSRNRAGQGSCSEPAQPFPGQSLGCHSSRLLQGWAGFEGCLLKCARELLHTPAAPAPLLLPCGFHPKMLSCTVLPHCLTENHCLSLSLQSLVKQQSFGLRSLQ